MAFVRMNVVFQKVIHHRGVICCRNFRLFSRQLLIRLDLFNRLDSFQNIGRRLAGHAETAEPGLHRQLRVKPGLRSQPIFSGEMIF